MGGITTEPPSAAAPPAPGGQGRYGRYLMAAFFLAPALVVLGVWVVYPAVYTIVRSFFGPSGYLGHWVGIDNYKTLFTTSTLTTAIKNNAIWVAVVPAFVSAIGLVFAVLTERVRWSVAFKTAVFLPMAISAFATGVTWRLMYQQDPGQGAVNALGKVFHDAVSPPGVLSSASPSTPVLQTTSSGAFVLRTPLRPGGVARLGLTAIPPTDVPASAKQAALPASKPGAITGVVWRDFKPGGGTPGKVEQGELGLPASSSSFATRRDTRSSRPRAARTGRSRSRRCPPGRTRQRSARRRSRGRGQASHGSDRA